MSSDKGKTGVTVAQNVVFFWTVVGRGKDSISFEVSGAAEDSAYDLFGH